MCACASAPWAASGRLESGSGGGRGDGTAGVPIRLASWLPGLGGGTGGVCEYIMLMDVDLIGWVARIVSTG